MGGNGNGRGWECLLENNGNWNKCLAGMGMGMEVGFELMEIGRNEKADSHSSNRN